MARYFMINNKFSVGLLVGHIEDDFSNKISKGAMRCAEKLDINLMIFPGKYIDRDYNIDPRGAYEYQSNVLFSFAQNKALDILIICAGSIGCLTTYERQKEFLDSFKDIPIITVASGIKGYTDVKYDNSKGIKEEIDYIVNVIHKTKIAVFCGNTENQDMLERFEAYKEGLQEHGIPIDNELISFGGIYPSDTEDLVGMISKRRDIEAIVCTNDEMAFNVYDVLDRLDIKVGKDIAVFGFDDIPRASRAVPPLATIRADAELLGYRAVECALKYFYENEQSDYRVDTHFVTRSSCGIKVAEINEIKILFDNLKCSNDIIKIGRDISKYLISGFNRTESEYNSFEYSVIELIKKLYSFISEPVQQHYSISSVSDTLNVLITLNDKLNIDFDKVYYVVEEVYSGIMQHVKNDDLKIKLHEILINYYKNKAKHLSDSSILSKEKIYTLGDMANSINREMLMFEFGSEKSYKTLLDGFFRLHINSSYMYLLEKPVVNLQTDKWINPEYMYLKAYQCGKNNTMPDRSAQKIHINEIYSNQFFPDHRFSMIVSDLYSNELQYGIIVFETEYEYFHYVGLVSYQMSAAIRLINLLDARNIIQRQLEESLENLKINNKELDNISKSDELTGLLNRRGFFSKAEELLRNNADKNKYAIVIYADMNNLKLINDRYGHEEGDFSLKLIGKILRYSFREHDAVGRIGGDEFAVISIVDTKEIAKLIKQRLINVNNKFNNETDKEYNILLSVGLCSFKCSSGLQITQMLEQADSELYEIKKYRSKNINKQLY